MEQYFTGQTLRLTATFRDDAGDPTDPTTITFNLRIDEEDIEEYVYGEDVELVKSGTGVYYIDVSLAASGKYVYQFIGTGTIEQAIEDVFQVLTALDLTPIVELQEAKDFLQIPHTDDDALINLLLLGMESTVREYLKSTVEATELTQYFNGDTPYILLPNIPVDISEGATFTVYDDIYDEEIDDTDMYRLIASTGHVYYNNEAQRWPEGVQRYRITYTAGLALRDDYDMVLHRIKVAIITWLSDIYYSRKPSNTWEKFDDIEERKELEVLPKRIEALLVGLIDVTNDF